MTPVARNRLLIVIAGTGVLLLFLHFLGLLAGAEAWLMSGLTRQESRLADTGRSVRSFASAPFRLDEILAQNEALENERNDLLVEVARLRKAEEENDRLRELLEFTEREKKTPVAAHVLAQTPQSGRHTILLDKGADHGITVDMPVVVGNGIIVGKIFRVDHVTAQALLLTDTRSHIGAAVQNEDRTLGVVQGQRGLSLEMRLIPQNQDIVAGDLVVTSGIEPLIPKGLVIGKVRDVETEERDPFKRATIESPVAFDQIEVVAVLFPG